MNYYRKNYTPRRTNESRGIGLALWHLFFATNDRFITYQTRRNWRARASFFFILGVLLTVAVQLVLGRSYGIHPLCPK